VWLLSGFLNLGLLDEIPLIVCPLLLSEALRCLRVGLIYGVRSA
jgi:hypothetical protein